MSGQEYFYRFIPVPQGPHADAVNSRLAGIAPPYHMDDSTAEGEGLDSDESSENVAADKYKDYVIRAQGLDTSDPFSVAKANPARKMFAGIDKSNLSPGELAALNETIRISKSNVTTAYTQGLLDHYTGTEAGMAQMDAALDRYRFIGKPQLQAGVSYSGHLGNVLAVMGKATKQLEIGAYQFEHPTVIGMALEMATKVDFRLTLNNPFGLGSAAYLGAKYLSRKLGDKLSPGVGDNIGDPNRWDHFKFIAADLGGDFLDPVDRTAAFVISSANFTKAAMGMPTRTGAVLGSNLESSFTLDYSLTQGDNPLMGWDVFNSLVRQARRARDWIRSGDNIAPDFTVGIDRDLARTRIVGTGQSWDMHQQLLARASATKGTIRILNFEIGNMYSQQLAQAIKSGATVEIIHGIAHTDNEEGQTATQKALANLRDQLSPLEQTRLKVVQSSNFVHAKMAIYSMGADAAHGPGVEHVMMLGSTNLTTGMLQGVHTKGINGEGPFGRELGSELQARDLDIVLSSAHASGILASQVSTFGRLFYGASLQGKSSAYRDWSEEQIGKINKAISDRSAAGDKYIGSSVVRVSRILDHKTGGLYGADINIGGQYTYEDHSGVSRTLNLGDVFNFSLVQKKTLLEGGTGYVTKVGDNWEPNQLYIPELAKNVGPVRGVGVEGSRDFDAYDTVAAGISTMNTYIGRVLSQFSKYTSYDVQDLNRSGYIRGRFRQGLKKAFNKTFANFEGIEMGLPVYNAKSFSRLNYGFGDEGLLSLDPSHIPELGATNIEYSNSDIYRNHLNSIYSAQQLLDMGIQEYDLEPSIYRPSGVSKPKGSATSAARTFNLSGFAGSLSISAKLGEDDYFFALPVSKIIQLAQRIGNIMSARAMLTPKALAGDSLLASSDGQRVAGARVKGYMAMGLGGDIAYVDSASMSDEKFGLPFRKEVKIRNATVDIGSLDSVRNQMLDLKSRGLANDLGEGRYEITTEGLTEIGHKLHVFDVLKEGHRVNQYLELSSSKHTGASPGMVINTNELSTSFRGGMFVMDISGETRMHLQTGSRIMVGIKDPLIFTKIGSRLFKELDRMAEAAGDPFKGNSGIKIAFGSSGVKTGEILLQTGLELIRSGSINGLLQEAAQLDLGKYTQLFERFAKYVDPTVLNVVRSLDSKAANDRITALERLFNHTAGVLASEGYVRINQSQHIAAAFLAFGIHAETFTERLRGIDGRTDPLGIVDFIPVYGTVPIAANNTPMSSRNRVNFLNYHAGQYTDAFMDMMAMDPRVQSRANAFREILGAGLLHSTKGGEVLVAGVDASPMTGYLTSLHDEFVELTALERYSENKKSKYKYLDPEALTQKINELDQKLNNGLPRSSYVIGNYDAAYTTRYLQAEKAAGVGARTLLVPELGRWSEGPLGRRFVFDQSSKKASMREVRLVSPESLLAIGQFDDFTHEVARLQVQLLERLPDMMDVFKGGKVGHLDIYHRRKYDDFMQLVGGLEEAQAALAATDFQKMLGGQMAVSGYNMVVGTHKELPAGYMVVGNEVFSEMKKSVATEIRQTLKAMGGDPGEHLKALAKSFGLDIDVGPSIKTLKANFAADRSRLNAHYFDSINAVREKAFGVGNNIMETISRIQSQVRLGSSISGEHITALGNQFAELGDFGSASWDVMQALESVQDLLLNYSNSNLIASSYDTHTQISKLGTSIMVKGPDGVSRPTGRGRGVIAESQLSRFVSNQKAKSLTTKIRSNYKQQSNLREDIKQLRSNISDQVYEISYKIEELSERIDTLSPQVKSMRRAFAKAKSGTNPFADAFLETVSNLEAQLTDAYNARRDLSKAKALMSEHLGTDKLAREVMGDYAAQYGGKPDSHYTASVAADVADMSDRLSAVRSLLESNPLLSDFVSTIDNIESTYSEIAALQDKGSALQSSRAYQRAGAAISSERVDEGYLAKSELKGRVSNLEAKRRQFADRIQAHKDVVKNTLTTLAGQAVQGAIPGLQAARDEALAMSKAEFDEALKTGKLDINKVVDELLSNQTAREVLMPGMYQRSGAPMGPMGINGATIITAKEFNERFGKIAPVDESRFNRSVLLSYGGMMFNLGDFDGDTMSVARIGRYSGLKMMDILGKLHTASLDEQGAFHAVSDQLSMDIRERSIIFARQYLGGTPLFKESDLYKTMKGLELDQAKVYLRGLKNRAARGETLTTQETSELDNFESRLQKAYDLSIGAVSFAKDIYGVTIDVENHVMESMMKNPNLTREAVLDQVLKGLSGKEIYDKYRTSVMSTLVDNKGGLSVGAGAFSAGEVSALIAASAYAGTVLIGKTFETAYAIQTYFGAQRGELTSRIARELRPLGYTANLHRNNISLAREDYIGGRGGDKVRELLFEYDLHGQLFEDMQTLVLLAQQMARDAIKPKLEHGAIAALRQFIADGHGAAPSGIMFVRSQERTIALEALQELINSKDLYKNPGNARYIDIHRRITAGFKSYLLDQVDGLVAMSGNSQSYLEGLLTKNDIGWSLMTKADLKQAAEDYVGSKIKDLPEGELKGKLQSTIDNLTNLVTDKNGDLQINYKAAKKLTVKDLEGLTQAHLTRQAKQFADLAMGQLYDANLASHRQDYIRYASAMNAPSPEAFFSEISGLDTTSKIKAFANLTARGSIRNHTNMGLALHDILLDFGSAEALRDAALDASDSAAFADNMYNIYKSSKETGNYKHAIDKMMKSSSVRPIEIDNQIETLKAGPSSVETNKKIQDLEEEKEKWKSLARIKSALGINTFNRGPGEKISPIHMLAGNLGEFLQTKTGQSIDTLTKNHILPGFLMGSVLAGVIGTSQTAQAQTLVTASAMAHPINLSKTMAGDPNAAVRGGIIAASLATGALGALAGAKTAHGMLGHGLDHMGVGIASAIGGTVAALGTGLLLEGLAKKWGMIKDLNPIPQAVASLMGTSVEQFSDKAESTDEIEQEAGISTEDQVVWDATGETLGFWSQDDGDGGSDYVQPDIDVSVTTYEDSTTDSAGFNTIKDYFDEK